ncbi:MAG TPA: hypothetical protein VEU72_05345 [Nitrosopumilaceae archaeon]|nr:hypothetical protein [Nitrosopumilaceae archaeon]
MKLFASLHNPKTRKYGIYYSVVLSSISAILILEGMNLVHLTIAEHFSTYFEGFFSLYMISRHDIGQSFLQNLNHLGLFVRK